MAEATHDSRGLSDSEIVGHYLDLSKQLDEQYRERRSLEWKMHLALWALLAGVTYVCVTENQSLGNWVFLGLMALPIHAVWIVKIVRGQIRDQELSVKYRKKAEAFLHAAFQAKNPPAAPKYEEEGSRMPEWIKRRFKHFLWWPFVQLGTTTLLTLALIALARGN